jgi:acyl carrier protein
LLATSDALEALERLLEDDAAQAGVIQIDWAAWQRSYSNGTVPPYLSLLVSGVAPCVSSGTLDGHYLERVLAAPPEKRAEVVIGYLTKQIARILKAPLASVDTERPISSMGFDSLMSIELRNQIERDFGVNIAMARLVQGPTLSELANQVMRLLGSAHSADTIFTTASSTDEFEEGAF